MNGLGGIVTMLDQTVGGGEGGMTAQIDFVIGSKPTQRNAGALLDKKGRFGYCILLGNRQHHLVGNHAVRGTTQAELPPKE